MMLHANTKGAKHEREVKTSPLGRSLLIVLLVAVNAAWLDPFRDRVSEGNSRFQKKKYIEAKKKYNQAEEYAPGEKAKQKLAFNRGDADYMAGDYDAAIAGYKKAIQSGDADVQKKAFFNLGNTYFRKKKYKEAFNAYMNALKIDPDYAPAKQNIEYMLLNQKKKQKDKNNKDGKKGNKNDKNKQQNKDDKNKQKNQNRDKQKQNQQRQKKQQRRMSRQQLKNLLKSMKKKPVRRQKGQSNDRRNLEKDW